MSDVLIYHIRKEFDIIAQILILRVDYFTTHFSLVFYEWRSDSRSVVWLFVSP